MKPCYGRPGVEGTEVYACRGVPGVDGVPGGDGVGTGGGLGNSCMYLGIGNPLLFKYDIFLS